MPRSVPDYDTLDPRLFKAFVAAARTLNFTAAAGVAAMTQSGISQHVARLEEAIGLPLFERVNKTVLLTPCGRDLLAHIEDYADRTAQFLAAVRGEDRSLAGPVTYAMPPSCLLSPHLPALLAERAAHPEIELRVRIRTNARVYQAVLAGEADFGFVTRAVESPATRLIPFCTEEYVVVGPDRRALAQAGERGTLAGLPFVSYPGMRSCLDRWLLQTWPKKRRESLRELHIAASINSIEGALVMVRGGVGATAMPRHCVEPLLAGREVHLLQGGAAGKSVTNDIAIVTLASGRRPRRVEQVIEWFLAMRD